MKINLFYASISLLTFLYSFSIILNLSSMEFFPIFEKKVLSSSGKIQAVSITVFCLNLNPVSGTDCLSNN